MEAAEDAHARFLPANSEIVIFGLGLRDNDVGGFVNVAKPPPTESGFSPVGETGLFECVSAEERIVGGGDTAGFELLATEFGILTHSWLCNGLERDCAKELGVAPNRRGFIPSYPEGQHCVEFISKDETRAAPGLWLPWLVIVYSPR